MTMALEDLHDDEIKARLGLPIERERDYEGPLEEIAGRVEDRIETLAVASMPEEFDPQAEAAMEIDFEVLDITALATATTITTPLCSCSGARYDGDDGWDRDCPIHGVEASE